MTPRSPTSAVALVRSHSMQSLIIVARKLICDFEQLHSLGNSLLDFISWKNLSLKFIAMISQPFSLSACQPVSLSACLPVSLCLSACQPVCLSACLPVSLSACQPVSLSVCRRWTPLRHGGGRHSHSSVYTVRTDSWTAQNTHRNVRHAF